MNNPKWKVDKNEYTRHFDKKFNMMLMWLEGAEMCSEGGEPLFKLCVCLRSELRAWLGELHNIEWHAEEDEVDE